MSRHAPAHAGPRRRSLRRDVGLALLLKAAMLLALFLVCFGPDSRPDAGAEATRAHVLAPTPPSPLTDTAATPTSARSAP